MASGGMGALGWLMGASTLMEAYGIREQGRMARVQSDRERVYREFAQWNAERVGAIAVASSRLQAREEERQADLVASRALAVAAASGGGVSDPTVVNIIARTKGEGAYRANVALYEGAERARQLRIAAAGGGDFNAGDSIMAGANAAALGRLARGGLSLYAKYGLGGPGGGDGKSGDEALLDAGTPSFSATA
jgi:hypothetical protein